MTLGIRHPDRLFIGGQWVPPIDGAPLDVITPHTGDVAATVTAAGPKDMDAAVEAARRAFDGGAWARMSPATRAGYLQRLQQELERRADDLSAAGTLQTGALAMSGPMMFGLAMHMLGFYANGAGGFRFVEAAEPADGSGVAVVAHEPVGVAVLIAPWNAPLTIMMNKLAPALLAGCAVIMKPAPETPLEAYIIAEAAEAAGLPPGVLSLVPADRESSEHLVSNPGVDKVAFTGSTAAGKRIAAICGARIGRCGLELGGKSAAIVLDDFDLADAARMLAGIITIATGQVCVTLSRVIVARHRHDELVEHLKQALEAVRVGDPSDPETQMGPLAIRRQLDRVESYIAKGVEEGATLVCGGGRPRGLEDGCYINPTLFANVSNDMTIAQEEIFGPVISVIPCEDEDDAVRIANESNYGLFGAVLTHDNDKAYRIARQVRAGAYAQNGLRLDYFLPFGGFKQSGIGREGGASGLRSFTETKTLLLDELPATESDEFL